MILKDMYLALKELFTQLYYEAFVKDERSAGFKFYIFSKESSAHKALNECVIEFSKVRNGAGSWKDVEVAFDAGYKNNSGSKLAPFFLVFKSDALFEQGKTKEAIEALGKALKVMSEKDDFYGAYKAKVALMQLDSADESVKKEGLDSLEKLADTNNSGQVVALYYLGLYSFDKNDTVNAKKYWQKLVQLDEEARKKDDSGIMSKVTKYVGVAREKLEQLS